MPLFDYRCESCQYQFEYLQFRQEEQPSCPKCQAPKTQRLLGSFVAHTGNSSECPPTDAPPCHPRCCRLP